MKEIPNNMLAEESVIGAMLLSKFALQKACDALTAESFYYESNAKIFDTIKKLNQENIPIDTTTLTSELKKEGLLDGVGGIEYLTELFTIVPTAANVDQYIKIVQDNAVLRHLIEVSTDITTSAYDNTQDISNTLDEENVRVYLTKVSMEDDEEIETQVVLNDYDELSTETNNGYQEEVLYSDNVPEGSRNYSQKYRLRMWVNEDTDFSPIKDNNGEYIVDQETGDYVYNNQGKTFSITVNVYADGRVITDEIRNLEASTEIETLSVGNSTVQKVENQPYNFYK